MKKQLKSILAGLLAVMMLAAPMRAKADFWFCETNRLYNPANGVHYYTMYGDEVIELENSGWVLESVCAWFVEEYVGDSREDAPETKPAYRMYNPNTGDYHFTLDAAERDALVGFGWVYERESFYVYDIPSYTFASGVTFVYDPVYRVYNPNAVTGSHHYTKDAAERDALVRMGWIDEGIAWYVANY